MTNQKLVLTAPPLSAQGLGVINLVNVLTVCAAFTVLLAAPLGAAQQADGTRSEQSSTPGVGTPSISDAQLRGLQLPSQVATNRWLDPKLRDQVNADFERVLNSINEAVKLTNNEAADRVIDRARADLEKLSSTDIQKIITNVTNLLGTYRQEANQLASKAASGNVPVGWASKYFGLANQWRGVVGALELRVEELAAIKGDLSHALETLDTARDYWRSAVRLDAAAALNVELTEFISDLRKIRDQLQNVTAGGILKSPRIAADADAR